MYDVIRTRTVPLATETASVLFEPGRVVPDQLVAAVTDAGYTEQVQADGGRDRERSDDAGRLGLRLNLALAPLGVGVSRRSGAGRVVGGRAGSRASVARARHRITIRGNLRWALGFNLIALPVAAGKLSPVLASASMATSSLIVVLNSLRLREFAKNVR